MKKLVSIHVCTDRPQEIGAFYQKVLDLAPSWTSDEVIGFIVGGVRLEIMGHDEVFGKNKTPQRLFFDLQVDDVRAEFDRVVALGAAVVQAPYDYADDQVRFTLATLADPDGNYFQLVSMNEG